MKTPGTVSPKVDEKNPTYLVLVTIFSNMFKVVHQQLERFKVVFRQILDLKVHNTFTVTTPTVFQHNCSEMHIGPRWLVMDVEYY